jgi:hypothetical protein
MLLDRRDRQNGNPVLGASAVEVLPGHFGPVTLWNHHACPQKSRRNLRAGTMVRKRRLKLLACILNLG